MTFEEQQDLNLKMKQVLDNVREIVSKTEQNPYDVFEYIWEEGSTGTELDIEEMIEQLNS